MYREFAYAYMNSLIGAKRQTEPWLKAIIIYKKVKFWSSLHSSILFFPLNALGKSKYSLPLETNFKLKEWGF